MQHWACKAPSQPAQQRQQPPAAGQRSPRSAQTSSTMRQQAACHRRAGVTAGGISRLLCGLKTSSNSSLSLNSCYHSRSKTDSSRRRPQEQVWTKQQWQQQQLQAQGLPHTQMLQLSVNRQAA